MKHGPNHSGPTAQIPGRRALYHRDDLIITLDDCCRYSFAVICTRLLLVEFIARDTCHIQTGGKIPLPKREMAFVVRV